eukprot:IDg23281t1
MDVDEVTPVLRTPVPQLRSRSDGSEILSEHTEYTSPTAFQGEQPLDFPGRTIVSCDSFPPNNSTITGRTKAVDSRRLTLKGNPANALPAVDIQVPATTARNMRTLNSGGGMVVESGMTELISVAKDIKLQLMQWRQEDAARREKDSAIMQKILDCSIALCGDNCTEKDQNPLSAPNSSSFDLVTSVRIAQ